MKHLTEICPGVYTCPENHCHIDVPALLIQNGYEPTPENCDMITTVLEQEIDKWMGEVYLLQAKIKARNN